MNATDEWGLEIIPEVKFKSAILKYVQYQYLSKKRGNEPFESLPYPFECKFRDRGDTASMLSEDDARMQDR